MFKTLVIETLASVHLKRPFRHQRDNLIPHLNLHLRKIMIQILRIVDIQKVARKLMKNASMFQLLVLQGNLI